MSDPYSGNNTRPALPLNLILDGEPVNYAALMRDAAAGVGLIGKLLDFCTYVGDLAGLQHYNAYPQFGATTTITPTAYGTHGFVEPSANSVATLAAGTVVGQRARLVALAVFVTNEIEFQTTGSSGIVLFNPGGTDLAFADIEWNGTAWFPTAWGGEVQVAPP